MNFIENNNLELKEKYIPDIKKEVIAFANTQGGTIYIGVADDGRVVGVEKPDDIVLQVGNAIRDSIKPDVTLFVDYDIEMLEGENVVKVSVQRGVDRPYYLGEKGLKPSGVYVRQGAASVPASEDAIRKMIKETDGDSYERLRSFNQDLTFDYLKVEMNKRNLQFGASQMKTLGLIGEDDLYTNLALLLSEQCLHSIKIAYFEGSDKSVFKDRREFNGSLLSQLSDAYEFIDLLNKTKATFKGLERTDERDYPKAAIREALINTIVHREYSFSGSTLINIYDNRMEFISLGGLVQGLSIESIMLGVSQSRNERLANFFYRLKLIESYGTGISKIISSYDNLGTGPTIEAVDGAFKVVLPNINYFKESLDRKSNNSLADSKYMDIQNKIILDEIKVQGSITRKEVEKLLGVGQSQALRILKKMTRDELLKQNGKGKGIFYNL